jgi:hypothetical protein
MRKAAAGTRWIVEQFHPAAFDSQNRGWSVVSTHQTRREAEAAAKARRAPQKLRMQFEQNSFRVRRNPPAAPPHA